ncbi:MAG: hypothetical protein RIR79_1892 [Pseudomonadota bacterium]
MTRSTPLLTPMTRCVWRILPWLLSVPVAASAQNLVDLVTAAQGYDATYRSAKAQFDANVAKADQARAAILPTIGLAAGASTTSQEVQPMAARSYNTQSLGMSATQPLYRPANWAGYQQGLKSVDIAKAQLTQAEQDLLVRVSQAYFDVLSATDTLSVIKNQKKAVSEQLASAKRNFEVGTATITDTRDAQARFDLVVAQQLAAENDLLVKSLALNQLVGMSNAQPKPLKAPTTLPSVAPADVAHWVDQSQTTNPSVQQATIALDMARLEVAKAEAGHKPTLDLVGSYSAINNNGGNSASTADSRINVASVGLNLTIPLFAGFALQNRVKETLSLEEKAVSDLENAKRSVAQGTRAAFYGVQSGQAQVAALQAAEASSQSALEANQLGYQVGVKINIDVLNAQTQLFDTQAKLAKARYDVLLGNLKLRQVVGTLQAQDLQAINAQLAP